MKWLFSLFTCLAIFFCKAQNITQAEYFFDTDPGVGKGVPVATGASAAVINIQFNAATGALSPGFHNLCFRTKTDNGIWGLFESRSIYITTSTVNSPAITAAEYFIDTDPGAGKGIAMNIGVSGNTVNFNAAIPTNALSTGFHNLAVRTKDASGKWGLYESRSFYVSTAGSDAAVINAAEYFIDTDPGPGKGLAMSIGASGNTVNFTANIPANALAAGFHNLGIRTRDGAGKWGLYETRSFYVTSATTDAPAINAAEYFIDTDPGAGKATPMGVGLNGNTVNYIVNIPANGLGAGFHNLCIRTRDAAGKWGLFESRSFYVSAAASNAPAIVAAESFIDVDPGVGMGNPILVSPSADTVKQVFVCEVPAGTANGSHMLFIRVKNATGVWGLYDSALISVTGAPTPVQKPGSGNAITMDGVDDRVDLGTGFTAQNFTIEMWVKPGATQVQYANIIDNNHSGSFTNWVCQQDADNLNKYAFGVMNTSASFTLSANQWQHIALVKSATTIETYVNGILSQSTLYNAGAINYSGNFLRLGSWGGGGRNWNGSMDEVRLYNIALTQSQIRDRMCHKITNSDALYNNLLGYYNFDESAGNIVFDGSASINNGTLVNSPARTLSGAAIGNTSIHHYVTSGLPATNLSVNSQDNLAVNYTAGTFTGTGGTHIYAVTEKPNTEAGIINAGSNDRYFGIFNVNLASPAYTATYNYTGNPFVTGANEASLALYKRADNAAGNWSSSGASLNTNANTLTVTGQNTEYMIGIGPLLQPGTIGSNQTICATATAALLTNTASGSTNTGGTITYQWQDSTVGGSWKNIAAATALTYQPATLAVTTWFRRIAMVNTLTASSNEISITVLAGPPSLIPGITVNNRQLTASALAGNATGYQWYKDAVIINGASSQVYNVPNLEAGSFTVAFTNLCGTGTASTPVAIGIAKSDQTISFTPVAAKTFGDAPFNVSATASSGLAISSYSIVSGPATISGTLVTITGAGTIVVKATQDGNASFNPAENTLQVTVNKASASIVFSNLSQVYDGTEKQAIATTTPLGLNTAITYNGSAALPVNAGNYAVTGSITSPNYQGTGSANLLINKANQVINIINPGNKSYNGAPFGVSATASSGLPVTLTIQTVPASGVASISGNTITLLGNGGTVTIFGNQAGNANFNAATQASTSFTVSAPESKDLQVIALLSPVNGCQTGLNAPVSIRIRNTGTQAASGFTVGYQINNEPPVTQTFSGSIAPNTNADVNFTQPGVFPLTGVYYKLTSFTQLTGDQVPQNDTLLSAVIRYPQANMFVSNDTAICFGGTATLRSFGAGSTQWTDGPSTSSYSVNPTATTTYTATLTDANNCSTVNRSVKVIVNDNPVVNAGPDQSILKGSSANLQATGAQQYLWNTGATTAGITVSPQNTTTYTVTGKNAAGCSASDDVTVTVNFSSVSVSPGIVQFGGVVVDSSKTLQLVIANSGTLPETVNSITGFAAPFSSNIALPIQLPAGTSVQVPVQFSPIAPLISQGTLQVNTTAGNFTIALRGTGAVPAPAWTLKPASYDFGKVETGTSVTQPIEIINTGNIAIQISSISSSSARFTGTTSGITTIPVGGSVPMQVKFSPLAVTSYSALFTIRAGTPNLGILRPIVTGIGYKPGNPPVLEFVDRPPFDGQGGVALPVGQPGVYTYSILYKHPNGVAPADGFPKVGIDKNKDHDFADAGEGMFTMEKEGNSANWAAGVVYSFTTYLPVSELYGYQFFASDINNNEADPTEYKTGPLVSREILDLHIYASDIVFSKPNPAVNETFTVTATIHNNSPYAAADIPIRFYYKDSLFLFNDTIPFIDPRSTQSITRQLSFSPDGFYPIKVWIDSSQTLGEGNILNNYASRPVIVGDFTVPGTIDLISNASPSGCNRGKITFTGRANYRGLNLAGTPPVEGAEVTISILNRPGSNVPYTIKTTTDINGNWYYYDDPCADNPGDVDCMGYICGVTYNYTVEVTDFTLTSPASNGSVTRPCVPCDFPRKLQSGIGVSGCIVDNKPYTVSIGFANFELDFIGRKICAPSVYKDTIFLFIDGQFATSYTLDSITACGSASFNYAAPGLAAGPHEVSFTHSYYFANNERVEEGRTTGFEIIPDLPDLRMNNGVTKTGHTSFAFSETNIACGTNAGPHMVYLYDSLPGYAEKVLIDSFVVDALPALQARSFSYGNPLWEPGCHYLTMATDVKQVVPELDEENNIATAIFCVDKPDIRFAPRNSGNILVSSSSANPGSFINFETKITNEGLPIHSPFAVQFKTNGTALGTKINVPSLDNGQEVSLVSAPFTVPQSECPVFVTAAADVDQVIDESNEKNNADTTIFGININAGRSCNDEIDNLGSGFFNEDDILGSINCLPYVAPKGVLTYLATTVRNTGTRDAKNVKVLFKLEGLALGTDVIPLLKAGQAVESGFYYAFDTVGRFIINAFADYTREICEIDEKDNIGFIHVDTKPNVSDLEILSQYIAPSNLNPLPNQSITVVTSVVNKGDEASVPAKMRFWVNDEQLGEDIPIDSIYPGQDTTVMATASYASGIVGPKVIKVRADIDNTVRERTKANNEATRAIIVGAAPDFARAKSEAITLNPVSFQVGDSIFIRHYIRNYGGDGGAAWVHFYYRNLNGEKILIDSVRLGLENNDSSRIQLRWKVAAPFGQIITEIVHSVPPEFNELNNIDSLHFEVALPLHLLSFTGQVKETIALLNWQTSSEVNVRHFELERSTNGYHFQKITTVAALNGSGLHAYKYADSAFASVASKQVYYRLRMVDIDGHFSYSPVVTLSKNAAAGIVKVYPNPTSQNLLVQVAAFEKSNYRLRVIDVNGKLCMLRQWNIIAGTQTISLPVQMLPAGVYVLMLDGNDGIHQKIKFIKE